MPPPLQSLSLLRRAFLNNLPSHPLTCLLWINSRSPLKQLILGGESRASRTLCCQRPTHIPARTFLKASGVPAAPSRWSCLFVSFLLSWHFYWNSETPHVYFCTASERLVPRWLTQKAPFARLKLNLKNEEKIKTVQPLQWPRHALSLQSSQASNNCQVQPMQALGDGSAGPMGFVRADLKETLRGIQFPRHFFPLQLQLLWPWTINFWHFRHILSGDRALRRYFSEEYICHYTISCTISSLNNHIPAGSDRRPPLLHEWPDVRWSRTHKSIFCTTETVTAVTPTSSTGKFVPLQNNWPEARNLFMAWCALLRCQLLVNWLLGVLVFF